MADILRENDDGAVESLQDVPDFEVSLFEELKHFQGEIFLSVYKRNPNPPHKFIFGGPYADYTSLNELFEKIQSAEGEGVYYIMLKTGDGRLKKQVRVAVGKPISRPPAPVTVTTDDRVLELIKPIFDQQSQTLQRMFENQMTRSAAPSGPNMIEMMTAVTTIVSTLITAMSSMNRNPVTESPDPLAQMDRLFDLADRIAERSLPAPEPKTGDWILELVEKITPAFAKLAEIEHEKIAVARMAAVPHFEQANVPQPVAPSVILSTTTPESIMNLFKTYRERYNPQIVQFIELAKLGTNPQTVADEIDNALEKVGIGDDDVLNLLKRPDFMALAIGGFPELKQYEAWVGSVRESLISLIEGSVQNDDHA